MNYNFSKILIMSLKEDKFFSVMVDSFYFLKVIVINLEFFVCLSTMKNTFLTRLLKQN